MGETYGELVSRLCRLRDEMKKTPAGRAALGRIKDILTLMADQKIGRDLARRYVNSWTKG